MDRRGFLRVATGTGTILMVAPGMLMIEGCPLTKDNAVSLINTLLNSALALVKVIDPTAGYYNSVEAAVTAFQTAEATWKAGGAIAIVEDALNTLEGVLAVIPVTAAYSPLVDILVAAIESVFAVLGYTPVTTKKLVANAHKGKTSLRKPGRFQSPQGAYKQQWNDVVNGTPALAAAKL